MTVRVEASYIYWLNVVEHIFLKNQKYLTRRVVMYLISRGLVNLVLTLG